jgi:probable rRNA maturation factor
VAAASTLSVDVQVACDHADVPHPSAIRDWVELAINSAEVPLDGASEIAVRVVDADEIQSLNAVYRQKDNPTNVLSFPAGRIEGLPADQVRLLGDVVVCAPVVAAEAKAQAKVAADHWGHILVHGTLHLLGYDHDSDTAAARMEGLEAQVLAQRGIANPYASSA